MGQTQCCSNQVQSERMEEIRSNHNKYQQKQQSNCNTNNKYDTDDNKSASTGVNVSNYKRDSVNNDDECSSQEDQENNKNNNNSNIPVILETEEISQYPSEIMRIKAISKMPSDFRLYNEERFLYCSKILNKNLKMQKLQEFQQNGQKELNQEEFDQNIQKQQEWVKKVLKSLYTQKMFGSEIVIDNQNYSDPIKAKIQVENFADANSLDFIHLNRLVIWFNESWYDSQTDITNLLKGIKYNIPPGLKQLQLMFLGMKIGLAGSMELSSAIKKLKLIESMDLNLDTVHVGSLGAVQIGQGFQEINKSLQELKLNLSNNDIDQCGFSKLFNGLQKHTQLTSLDLILKGNIIDENCGKEIAQSIQKFTNLKKLNLNLSETKIESESANKIIEAVLSLEKISVLYLGFSENLINDDGILQICELFKKVDKKRFSNLYLSFGQNEQITENVQTKVEEQLKSQFSEITFCLFL